MSEDISGCKREKKEGQTEESRLVMKREEVRLRHYQKMLKGSGRSWPGTKGGDAAVQEA